MLNIKTVIGFDFGLKHIGVAIGQTLTATAQPRASLPARVGQPDWRHLIQLLGIWGPDALLVGIPLNMDDTEQMLTRAARLFSLELQQRSQLPVYCVDERLSTVEARSRLFASGGYKALKKEAIDSVSAQLIVETWLVEWRYEQDSA